MRRVVTLGLRHALGEWMCLNLAFGIRSHDAMFLQINAGKSLFPKVPTNCSILLLQDGFYLSLQRRVDWFAVMIGVPPERKYNSVLFGGMNKTANLGWFQDVFYVDVFIYENNTR